MYPPPQTFCLQVATGPLAVSASHVRAVLPQLAVLTSQVKVVDLPSSTGPQPGWAGMIQNKN